MRDINKHQAVLLTEAVDALITNDNGYYLDGTFGRGGHSQLILNKLSNDGRLMAIDKDLQAISCAKKIAQEDSRFQYFHGSFVDIEQVLQGKKINGLLLDLGVSSPQLDDSERGFSFMKDGPLDMRMNCDEGESAQEWINKANEGEISKVLWEYGEERFSRRIAKCIVEYRKLTPITTTKQLADLISSQCPYREKRKHPATRSFQAIRIYINRELEELSQFLEKSIDLLKPGGRMVVISFHSLEDRIVKRFIRLHSQGKSLPKWVPVQNENLDKRLLSLSKAIKASDDEVKENPRARSAVMRIAQKLI